MTARTLAGPLSLTGDYDAGEDGWTATMNANLLKLSALAPLIVKSRVTTLPGSPTNGDIYIVPSGAGSHPNEIAVRDNGAWVYYTAVTNWRAWVADEAIEYGWSGSAWLPTPRPVALGTFSEVAPTASQILLDWVFADGTTFPDEFAGSRASVGTNPTSSFTATVQKNGSGIGTIVISTGGVASFVTTGGSVSFAAGDLLTIVAPGTPDATIARLRITLKGVAQ